MPVDVIIKGKKIRINPTNSWVKIPEKVKDRKDIKVLSDQFFVKY